MKQQIKIILLSCGLGLFLWLADTLLDYFIFYEGTFFDLLVLAVPNHELYIRSLILTCFIIFGVICARLLAQQQKTEQQLSAALDFQQHLLDTIPVPIFYKDSDYVYTGCNQSFMDFFGLTKEEIIGKSVYDLAPQDLAEVYQEKDEDLFKKPGVQVYEFEVKHVDKGMRHVIFNKASFHASDGQVAGLIGAMQDVTEKIEAEKKREELILELQEALDKVKTLSGFLPICSSCKKIRDDKGYWNQVDEYIQQHSQAEFSHGICPDCMRKLYPDFADEILSPK
ncbi:MAG: PAS domain-containing protein [Thermodesulfobacteriota bacterium]